VFSFLFNMYAVRCKNILLPKCVRNLNALDYMQLTLTNVIRVTICLTIKVKQLAGKCMPLLSPHFFSYIRI